MKSVLLGCLAILVYTDVFAKNKITNEANSSKEFSGENSQPLTLSPLNIAPMSESKIHTPNFIPNQLSDLEMKANSLLSKLNDSLEEINKENKLNYEINYDQQLLNESRTFITTLCDKIQSLEDQYIKSSKLNKDQHSENLSQDTLKTNEQNSMKILVKKLVHEKEEILQKLFEYQMKVQPIKTISFSLNNQLNQIQSEDSITEKCITFLNNLKDLNNRLDQLLKLSQTENITASRGIQMKSLIKELSIMNNLKQQELKTYKNHITKLTAIHNKELGEISNNLNIVRESINTYKKQFPELNPLDLDKNTLYSINLFKDFVSQQTKKKAKSPELANFENNLYKYLQLKTKESDINRLCAKIKNFSENITNIEVISEDFAQKYNKLTQLQAAALDIVKQTKAINDNNKIPIS